MARKKVRVEETTFENEDLQAGADKVAEGNGNGAGRKSPPDPDDDLSLNDVESRRKEAQASKYDFITARNKKALEELTAKAQKAQAGGDEDEMDKVQAQIIKMMKNQVSMQHLTAMIEKGNGGPKDDGHRSLRDELKEAITYLDRRLDDVTKNKGDDKMFQMMMNQQQSNMQMMMAMMNKQDPNAAMQQQILLKLMDSRTSMKDFLPMMSEMQKATTNSQSNMEQARLGMMQEILSHALSAGEKDWGSMSIADKFETVMGMMKKGGGFVMDQIKTVKNDLMGSRKYKKPADGIEHREPEKLGLNTEEPQAQPNEESQTGDTAKNPQPVAEPDDQQVVAIIRDRVKRILTHVETEMKLGSDPYLIFEEIEKIYFGLPKKMRDQIEAEPNPMVLLSSIEAYAEKAQLDRIVNAAMADAEKAEWLKEFHNAICGIDDEDDGEDGEEGEDDGDGPDEGEEKVGAGDEPEEPETPEKPPGQE